MKKKIIIQNDGNYLRVGNKWYGFSTNDDGNFMTGEHILYEVNKKKFDKKAEKITDELFSFVDPKLVMKDALKDLLEPELDKIIKYIEKKKKATKSFKPEIRKHCIQMRVGGVDIPIR